MLRFQAIAVAIILSAALSAPAQTPPPNPSAQTIDLHTIIQRVDEAARTNGTHFRPYVLTREYRLYGSDVQKPSSEVVAEVNFVPPATKDFKILQSSGSSRGESIVRKLLENEQKAATDGHARGSITSDHYEFAYLGESSVDHHDCYLLKLTPRHEDKTLIDGRAWVDKATYRVRRVEGEMSKLPSWWLKSVHVVLTFEEVDGMWMQNHTKAVAQVRIFGPHTFVSDMVSYHAGDTVAQNRGIKARKKNAAADVIGAAIMHDR